MGQDWYEERSCLALCMTNRLIVVGNGEEAEEGLAGRGGDGLRGCETRSARNELRNSNLQFRKSGSRVCAKNRILE